MFKKKCDGCQITAWAWQGGWHQESKEEASRREARSPILSSVAANLEGDRFGGWEPIRMTYCPDCLDEQRGFVMPAKPQPCSKCGVAVSPETSRRREWYEAEDSGYWCPSCKKAVCGQCATPRLQELKDRYGKARWSLKQLIDADQTAIVMTSEVTPRCPQCSKQPLLLFGEPS